jgi:hypothetical protein
MADDVKQFDNALKFANDLLTSRKTSISELKLHLNLADVTAAGWHAAASSILSGDFNPDNPNPKDLEDFRNRVLQLRSHLVIHQQMARRLAERYAEVITGR